MVEIHMYKLLLKKRWINLDSLKLTIEFSSHKLCNSIKTRESNNVRCKDSQEWMLRQWIVIMPCKQLREKQASSRVQISRGTIQQTNSIYRFRHRRQPMQKEAQKSGILSTTRAFQNSWVRLGKKKFLIARSWSNMMQEPKEWINHLRCLFLHILVRSMRERPASPHP